MNKMWLVMQAEIGAMLRRKLFTIFAFGVPLILGVIVLVYSLLNGGEARPSAISSENEPATLAKEGLVDEAGLIQAQPPGVPAGWLTRYSTEAAAQAALAAGEVAAYYVIPADYVNSGEIIYARPEYDPLSDEAPAGQMKWVLMFNLLGGDAGLAARVREPLDLTVTELVPGQPGVNEEHWLVELLPMFMVLILYMAILIPASSLVTAVIDEKKNRVMEVLLTSVSPLQMLSGKILAVGLLGLVQIALYGGLLWAMIRFGARPLAIPPGFSLPPGLLVWGAIFFLLGYGQYGGLLAGLGALVPDLKDSRSASMVIMAPMIVAYLFITPVLADPDGPLALVTSLFPLTAPISMIARMSVAEVPLWQAILSAALQLLTAIGILYLIARLFRAQTLLSGQPFSMARYFQAVAGRLGY